MKRKALLSVLAFLAAALVWPATAQATTGAVITPGDCSDPAFTYTLTEDSGPPISFYLDDGDAYAGSKSDTVSVYMDGTIGSPDVLTDTWEPPSAASEVQSAREVTLEITDGASTVYDTASFDFRTCFSYAAHDDFDAPESSKTARFGSDEIGATQTGAANKIRVSRFMTPPGISAPTSCSAYLDRTNASSSGYAADCVIYTDSSGVPGSLVTNGHTVLSTGLDLNTPAWETNTFSTPPTLSPNTWYWIGVHTAKQIIHYRVDNTAATSPYGCRISATTTYGTPPASWATPGTDSSCTNEYAVYLTYTDDGSLITSGNTVGNRTAPVGGSWTGMARSKLAGHEWYVDSLAADEGAAAINRAHESIGYATLDTNLTDEYSLSSLIELSPTTYQAAPGLTAAWVDSQTNVFFKLEITDAPQNFHHNGALVGGITSAGNHAGETSGCLKNNIGLTSGERYWLYVEKDGDVFTAKVFENRSTYGFSSLSDHIAKCTIDLSEHLVSADPVTCDAGGDDEGTGSLPCTDEYYISGGDKTALDAADRAGLRIKQQIVPDDHATETEDDGLSRYLSFYAYDTTGAC